MPTKQKLRIVQTKDSKKARVSLAFEFDSDDPKAADIYRGIGLCLREALTPEEGREFIAKLECAKQKLAKRRVIIV